MSTLSYIRETLRRELTEDDKFYKKMVYFFEMTLPPSTSAIMGFQFFFPFALNPEAMIFDEPFSVEETKTQGGGVTVEENGIITRKLTIRGHTGFKPRKLKSQPIGLLAVPSEKRSYDRQLPKMVMDAISGQRHFQYLQDAVFRTYADLKRDPDAAKDTRMFFHNPKDDEHWEVVPLDFRLERSAAKPITYNYNIELLVVDKASAVDADFSEDKSLLDSLKDLFRTINNAVNLLTGAVRDLTNIINEVKSYVAAIGTILSSVTAIIGAVTDFVNGVTSLIQLPAKIVKDLIADVEGACKELENTLDKKGAWEAQRSGLLDLAAANMLPELSRGDLVALLSDVESPLPIEVHQALQDIATGASLLLMHSTSFETPLQERIRKQKEKQALITSASADALAAAAAADSPSSLTEINALGTGLMPGDSNRALVNLTDAGADVPAYTGFQSVIVEQGDSLASIAGKFLGDARKWSDLANANDLKPPFVSGQAAANITSATDEEAFPGALGVGKILMVPNFQRPPEARPLLPVLGVSGDRSPEEKLLGADLALTRFPGQEPRYDVAINTEFGSNDARIVTGIANLRQAIELRVTIEKGTDKLYRKVGLEPIVGLKWVAIDKELIKFRVIKTVSADPRILGIRRATLTGLANGQPDDAVEVSIEADLIGFIEAATIKSMI